MFSLRCSHLLCLALLLPALASAQIERSTAESLMHKSGIWTQLASVGPQAASTVSAQFAQPGNSSSPEERQRVLRAVETAFAPAPLRSTVADLLTRKYKTHHVAALQRWYNSALGQTITRLEEQSSADTSDMQVQVQEGVTALKQMSSDRQRLLRDFLVSTRSVEFMTRLAYNSTLAMMRGMASISPGTPAPSETEFKAAFDAQRSKLMASYTALFMALSARTYATLSTEQMGQYVAFLKSEAGSSYNDLCMMGFDAALSKASVEFGRLLPGTRDQANS